VGARLQRLEDDLEEERSGLSTACRGNMMETTKMQLWGGATVEIDT
jgi:hypothetical protein